jgi:hypothetical protein
MSVANRVVKKHAKFTVCDSFRRHLRNVAT